MECSVCNTILLPHRACKKCGKYGDRSVKKTGMEEVKKVLKKSTKKVTAKATAKKAATKAKKEAVAVETK